MNSRTLLHRARGRDELVLVGQVDSVEAGADDRGRRDADVYLGRASVEEHRHELPRGVAAHDRVVDRDHALAGHLVERVELEPDAPLAELLVGLDERAADVTVLDQPLAERDARRSREADRCRCARVGDGEDEVRVDRRLLSQPLAHPHAGSVRLDAGEMRVRPGEVEVLEDAECAVARRRDGLDRP